MVIQYQDLSFLRIRCPTLWKQLTKIIWLIALFLKPSSDGHFWCCLDRRAISLTSESNFCSSRWVNIGHHVSHPSLLFSSLSVKRNRGYSGIPKTRGYFEIIKFGGYNYYLPQRQENVFFCWQSVADFACTRKWRKNIRYNLVSCSILTGMDRKCGNTVDMLSEMRWILLFNNSQNSYTIQWNNFNNKAGTNYLILLKFTMQYFQNIAKNSSIQM